LREVGFQLRPVLRDERVRILDDDDAARREERERVEFVADGGEVEFVARVRAYSERRVFAAQREGDDPLAGVPLEEVFVTDQRVDGLPLRGLRAQEWQCVHKHTLRIRQVRTAAGTGRTGPSRGPTSRPAVQTESTRSSADNGSARSWPLGTPESRRWRIAPGKPSTFHPRVRRTG